MVQFEMNPEIHDLLYAKDVREGMIVRGEYSKLADDQTKYIDWCTVTNLVQDAHGINFIGVYEDGTKATRSSNALFGWYVVKESIPADEIEPVTGLKIVDLPTFPSDTQLVEMPTSYPNLKKLALPDLDEAKQFVEGLWEDRVYEHSNVVDGDPAWVRAAETKWWDEKGTTTAPGKSCLNPEHYDPETGHSDELHERDERFRSIPAPKAHFEEIPAPRVVGVAKVDWDIDGNRPYSEKVAEEQEQYEACTLPPEPVPAGMVRKPCPNNNPECRGNHFALVAQNDLPADGHMPEGYSYL